MPRFSYKALARDGSKAVGELEAGGRQEAIRTLKAKGLHPLDVRQRNASGGRLPNQKHVVQFLEDIAGLVDSGIAIDRALHLATSQTEDPILARAGREMANSVHKGNSFAQAMESYTDYFGPAASPLVRAGEAAGRLAATLEELACSRRAELAFRKAFIASLVYPALLCIMSLLTLAVMIFYVMPNFALVFDSVDVTPPAGVSFLLAVGDMARGWWWLPLSLLLTFLLAIRFGNLEHKAKKRLDGILLHAPLLADITLAQGLGRYFSTLGQLLAGGVPLVTALSLSQRATGNKVLYDRLAPAVSEVKIGRPLSTYFSKNSFFPKRVANLLRIAEEQGALDKGCATLGARFLDDTKSALTRLGAWIEPVVIIATGLIIGVVVIGMFSTIVSVTNVDF